MSTTNKVIIGGKGHYPHVHDTACAAHIPVWCGTSLECISFQEVVGEYLLESTALAWTVAHETLGTF